jgi:hypothetical protein
MSAISMDDPSCYLTATNNAATILYYRLNNINNYLILFNLVIYKTIPPLWIAMISAPAGIAPCFINSNKA